MLLTEPPRSQYDINFHVLGIPVRVHPFFWLGTILLGISGIQHSWQLFVWIGAVFISILIHELGHALAARSFGYFPWITLHSFGGLASYRSRNQPREQILISLAGPMAGFLFAAVILAIVRASGHEVVFERRLLGLAAVPIIWEPFASPKLEDLIETLMFVNIYWGLVNLLPIYPLDGGQIARQVLLQVRNIDGLTVSLWLSIGFAAVVALLALTRLKDTYLTIFFAYLAYLSYSQLQGPYAQRPGRGGWG